MALGVMIVLVVVDAVRVVVAVVMHAAAVVVPRVVLAVVMIVMVMAYEHHLFKERAGPEAPEGGREEQPDDRQGGPARQPIGLGLQVG